jgi:hypothetical protein
MMNNSKAIQCWNWDMHLSILKSSFLHVKENFPLKVTFLLSNTLHSMVAYHTIDVSIIQKYCPLRNNKEQLLTTTEFQLRNFTLQDIRLVLFNIYSSYDQILL